MKHYYIEKKGINYYYYKSILVVWRLLNSECILFLFTIWENYGYMVVDNTLVSWGGVFLKILRDKKDKMKNPMEDEVSMILSRQIIPSQMS